MSIKAVETASALRAAKANGVRFTADIDNPNQIDVRELPWYDNSEDENGAWLTTTVNFAGCDFLLHAIEVQYSSDGDLQESPVVEYADMYEAFGLDGHAQTVKMTVASGPDTFKTREYAIFMAPHCS